MILRRITEHVKTQNWTAVALDFVIVVMGVFIGIQVSNWNAARIADAQAGDLLQRMIAEAEDARADMAGYQADNHVILNDALKLAARLNETDACLRMDDNMKELVLRVGDFPPPRFSLATAREALESGNLSALDAAEIRDSVRKIADEMNFMDRQWQRYIRIKQDIEQKIYPAAGLSLTGDQALKVLPGNEFSGLEQFRLQTPEGVCGQPVMIAYASNAALTQHIYTAYLGQVSDKLDAYAALLSAYSRNGARPANTETAP
ncbi:hypothetical protein ACFOOP_19175 [Marinicaulis aureus]|uniref:Flp pilus-assembly TadG-like N-terminal domain-containing protein n=1 Tax=Hyphococcus aureus TaxID=2666033 RepID=A0ABW1KY25_9PROT